MNTTNHTNRTIPVKSQRAYLLAQQLINELGKRESLTASEGELLRRLQIFFYRLED